VGLREMSSVSDAILAVHRKAKAGQVIRAEEERCRCGNDTFRISDRAGPAYQLTCTKCMLAFWVGEHEHCDGDCVP